MLQLQTRSLRLVARTADSPALLTRAAHELVWAIDPEQPITDSRSFTEILADLTSGIRLAARMMNVFAAVAFVLCAGGLYGLLAYSAAKRRHEIGVRMALGARPGDVMLLFVGAGLVWTALGLAIGLPAAWALARLLSGFLLGVLQLQPASFAILALVLLGVAAAASYGPARRAAAIDPVRTLRQD